MLPSRRRLCRSERYSTMVYSLYLSDIGYPPETSKENWIICRTMEQAVEIVKRVAPDAVYFGADLDTNDQSLGDCFDFVNWLVKYDETEDILFDTFEYEVEEGDFSRDITRIMTNYLRKKFS